MLGSYNPERQQYAAGTLTRFTAEGQLDTGYGSGTGRIAFGTGDGSSNLLVPSTSDTVTGENLSVRLGSTAHRLRFAAATPCAAFRRPATSFPARLLPPALSTRRAR
ncbi:MAG: hypothetical protein IPM02_18405 [Betaproteobacteria bacterium]|nr:hypothetical protein [Betaproteobacteria bacterium]